MDAAHQANLISIKISSNIIKLPNTSQIISKLLQHHSRTLKYLNVPHLRDFLSFLMISIDERVHPKINQTIDK